MVLSKKLSRAVRERRQNIGVILRLVFCFPLGLYQMWTATKWPRLVKVGVSALVAFLILVILTPLTDPPARQVGGIRVVGDRLQVDVLGPEAPEDREIVEIYTPHRTAIVVEPTPTPEPILVYVNNGGHYYHAKECRYVTERTPAVTLAQAISANYTRCPECDAPIAVAD